MNNIDLDAQKESAWRKIKDKRALKASQSTEEKDEKLEKQDEYQIRVYMKAVEGLLKEKRAAYKKNKKDEALKQKVMILEKMHETLAELDKNLRESVKDLEYLDSHQWRARRSVKKGESEIVSAEKKEKENVRKLFAEMKKLAEAEEKGMKAAGKEAQNDLRTAADPGPPPPDD